MALRDVHATTSKGETHDDGDRYLGSGALRSELKVGGWVENGTPP